jgi:hypothetical protein
MRATDVILYSLRRGGWALAVAAASAAVPAAALAADPTAVSFSHKDWALQCDNTRACSAVGYEAESGESEPVSIRLTRAAGPGTAVKVDLQVYTEKASPAALQITAGKFRLAGLDGNSPQVPAAQVPRLLQELLRSEEAIVTAGKDRWVLSLAGASAVLLKMDEVQGRLNTPGALVRKGAQPESSVPPAVPAPVVKSVKPVAARKTDAALAGALLAAVDRADLDGQCTGSQPDASTVKVHRLTDRKLLLEVPCGMGAYNFSSLLFMAHDRTPYQPRLLEDVDGEFDPATGEVRSAMKGRGIGDCWWMRSWRFDGRGFVLTGEQGDSMCRGFPGGAWQLPAYVTR